MESLALLQVLELTPGPEHPCWEGEMLIKRLEQVKQTWKASSVWWVWNHSGRAPMQCVLGSQDMQTVPTMIFPEGPSFYWGLTSRFLLLDKSLTAGTRLFWIGFASQVWFCQLQSQVLDDLSIMQCEWCKCLYLSFPPLSGAWEYLSCCE